MAEIKVQEQSVTEVSSTLEGASTSLPRSGQVDTRGSQAPTIAEFHHQMGRISRLVAQYGDFLRRDIQTLDKAVETIQETDERIAQDGQ
ncbi:hypothetical protein KIM372_06200 [Bombiscardovia nodaiensis]|uniref:TIGR04197 family type VII secretion effector n=1 Tax=Bombiscardovia nodaiensis TaxID=2932181 RepID=A0ABM8B784_9BIFI|nr:hypothetical protein KIM372_06200 [Bombiscardovia nodaiensis]